MSRFRKGGSVKRTDAAVTTARFGGKAPQLTKSSSAFFPNSTEHSPKVTKLAQNEGGGGGGGGLRVFGRETVERSRRRRCRLWSRRRGWTVE